MEFSIKLHSIKSGWSIAYIEGSHDIISQKVCISFPKTVLVLANCADPDEMQHYAAFHLGLHCLSKYPFKGFQSSKS